MEDADFIPNTFTVNDLIEAIKRKYGEDCDLSKVYINASHRQYKCFGYDLYDSGDYRIEFDFFI